MTPAQQELVVATFAQVAPIADQAAALFYEDLFARDPALRRLFPNDMTKQYGKLMQMLATAVANLGSWDSIAESVRALGARHAAYGLKPAHYEIAGDALIATLDKGLGPAFTPEVCEAWVACYRAVSAEMLAGC